MIRLLPRLLNKRSLSMHSMSTPIELPSNYTVRSIPPNISNKLTNPEMSVLSSGLRVVSLDCFGPISSLGVFIKAGPRYDVFYPPGTSHLFSKMVFLSTSKYENREQIMNALEIAGAVPDYQMDREEMIYKLMGYRHQVELMAEVLSEVVFRPRFTEEEVEKARIMIAHDLNNFSMHPDMEPFLTDYTYTSAFSLNTLGHPAICRADGVSLIKREHLMWYLAAHFRPSRMVLAGLGVEHDALLRIAERYFEKPQVSWGDAKDEPDNSIAQYTGSEVRIARNSPPIIGPNPLPNLAYFTITAESVPYDDPLFFAFAVLDIMMGGGSSFSAGGPGKGMYSRLYANVMNYYHFVYSAQSMLRVHGDTGIYSLCGSTPHEHSRKLCQVLVDELKRLALFPGHEELGRAKKMLQSNLLMNLESHMIHFEDLGRQALVHKRYHNAKELYDRLEKVKASDIAAAGQKLLKSKLSMAAVGRLEFIPTLKEVEEVFSDSKKRLHNSGSIGNANLLS